MHIPLWTILPYTARHNAPALLARTDVSDVCLPFQLQTAVPSCAIQCLQTFVANNYNTLICTSTADLSFLCTNPTYSGLTIGEGSLQCVISSCIGADIETQSGYTVCEGVSGALPNMAETITATISAISTIFSSTDSAVATATSTPLTSGTSDVFSASTSDTMPTTFTDPLPPTPAPTASTAIGDSLSGSSTTTPASSALSSSDASTSFSGELSTDSVSSTARTSSASLSSSSTSGTATSSATASAATESPSRSELGTSAIAGIVTAVVIVVALIVGYIAYWFCIKKKQKNRPSQRFSTVYAPPGGDPPTGSVAQATATNSRSSVLDGIAKRYYSREIVPENRQSFWSRSALPPNDIGVAVAASTRVSPERRGDTQVPTASGVSWPSAAVALHMNQSRQAQREDRWSLAESSDDDIEAQGHAQNQDLPVLGSPKTRASSRSFSSPGVEMPAPLRLSRIKYRQDPRRPSLMPLTPVYDNGTFEPTVRQVFNDADEPAGLIRLSREKQAPNFSRREPSLTRTSQDDGQPAMPQLQRIPLGRFPVKPPVPLRKQTQSTDRSLSVYTEIDEDSTPEEENDKQLRPTRPPQFPARMPLRDVEYPQIPRPAATKRQAEKPHSPRALTIRRVDPNADRPQLQPDYRTRAQMVQTGVNYPPMNPYASSEHSSPCSESPIFPTPPIRAPGRRGPPADLRVQISDAFRSASQPSTVASASTKRTSVFPPSSYPTNPRFAPQTSPTIQRLSTGRPLAQRLYAPDYVSRPLLKREQARPSLRSIDPRGEDLYFTVDELRR